jgi:hypothetical protein
MKHLSVVLQKKIIYFLLITLLGISAANIPAVCYALDSDGVIISDDNGVLMFSVEIFNNYDSDSVEQSQITNTQDIENSSSSEGIVNQNNVNFFDPEILEQIRLIIENNEGSDLTASSMTALQNLGLDAATINGIAQMNKAYPQNMANETNDIDNTTITAEEEIQAQNNAWFFIVFIVFLVVIAILIYIIVRKTPDS